MILTPDSGKVFSREMLDVLIRAGLIAILMIACYLVFHPFLNLMLWSVILAITLYPLHARLVRHLGGKQGLSATLLVTVAIGVLLVPVYLLAMSLADSVSTALVTARTGSVHVPPPAAAVADWPVVGPRIYDLWTQAATDLTGLAKQFAPQLKAASRGLLGKLAGLRSELTATALEGINPADAHRLLAQLETIKENVRNAIQNPANEPPKKEQRYG